MTIVLRTLASGDGWRVSDAVCTAGPSDPVFEERHRTMSIALVTNGTFEYRAAQGGAFMTPGSLLLGNEGTCFECGHSHGRGDRCISFQFTAEFFEQIVSEIPGARRLSFGIACLPSLPQLLPILSTAQVARDQRAEASEFLELTMRLAGAVCESLLDSPKAKRAPTARDEKRVALAVRRIEANPHERLTLSDLADEVAASRYHFLRVFEQVVGVTPGQYILRDRLRRAAVRLRNSSDRVSSIALECGFGDLSTFNRQFRRFLGVSPGEFRATRSART